MEKGYKTHKLLHVDNLRVTSPGFFKLTTQEIKNISDTFRYLVEDLNYYTPSDRSLVFDIEVEITRSHNYIITYTIAPFSKEYTLSNDIVKLKKLDKEMEIIARYTSKELQDYDNIQKQLRWVLNYYGLSFMYATHYKKIKVDMQNPKQIEITYA